MDFVDRVEELGSLEALLERDEPALIRLYGRRRLGKTELLRRLCEQHGGLYLLIDDADRRQLLDSLSQQVANEAGTLRTPYGDWDAFFEHLGQLRPPFVVFDEFQRLVENEQQAVTRLQGHWDRRMSEEGPPVILCGSSVGMMQRITDRKQGPLFGRLTGDMHLAPFSYGAARLLYPDLNEVERVRRFAVFGGTPYYHRFSVGATLEDAVSRAFLEPTAPLQEEPQSLLQLELKRPTRYNSILYEIGHGTHHLHELETKVGVPKGGLSPYLEVLRHDLDLIEMEDPVCGKRRKARYVFTDPFFAFYYRFIFGERPRLELGRQDAVWQDIEAELDAHIGLQFEEVAKQALIIANGTELDGVRIEFDAIGRWWNRTGEELDIVAKGPDEILAGEVKWSKEPVGPDLVHDLLRKASLMERTGSLPIRPLIVARAGLTAEAMEVAEREQAIVLDLDAIARLNDERFPA